MVDFFHCWFPTEDWVWAGHGEEVNGLYGLPGARQRRVRDPDVVNGAAQHAEGFAHPSPVQSGRWGHNSPPACSTWTSSRGWARGHLWVSQCLFCPRCVTANHRPPKRCPGQGSGDSAESSPWAVWMCQRGFEGREFSYMDSGQPCYLVSGPEDSPWSYL